MEWRVWFTKRDGSVRKQFRSWSVPSYTYGVEDGDHLELRAEYPGGSFAGQVRVTSGGEFNLPKAAAEAVSAVAAVMPESCIVFRICELEASNTASAVEQEQYYSDAVEGQPPERREYLRELFVRNRRHVFELKTLYSGICQITGGRSAMTLLGI